MEHCDISKLIDIMICSSIFVNMEKCLQHIRGKKIDSGTGYMELLYLIGFYYTLYLFVHTKICGKVSTNNNNSNISE